MTGSVLPRLRRQISECLIDHAMLSKEDRILVGLSGGKDSWALLGLLADLKERAPFPFSLTAVTIDGGLTGLDPAQFEEGCRRFGVPFHLVRQKIFETVSEKKDDGSTFCSLCAKLRRGALYSAAEKLGATKIALGHHLDDAIETLLLNFFYGGRLAALPPVLLSDSGHVPILRPLLYSSERDLELYVRESVLPVIGCACPVCPTHPEHEYSDLKRKRIKEWITRLSLDIPQLREQARAALKRVETDRFFDLQFTSKAN
ncbi:MAG: ATP-binding protein [Pseudomonadota bacterium]